MGSFRVSLGLTTFRDVQAFLCGLVDLVIDFHSRGESRKFRRAVCSFLVKLSAGDGGHHPKRSSGVSTVVVNAKPLSRSVGRPGQAETSLEAAKARVHVYHCCVVTRVSLFLAGAGGLADLLSPKLAAGGFGQPFRAKGFCRARDLST